MNDQRKVALLVAGCLLIFLSSVLTVVVINTFSSGASGKDNGGRLSRRFDLFENYDECESSVKHAIEGRVVSLVSDDRAARYEARTNINKLFFLANVAGSSTRLEHGVRKVFARCDVSAQTNRIKGVYLREEYAPEYIEAS